MRRRRTDQWRAGNAAVFVRAEDEGSVAVAEPAVAPGSGVQADGSCVHRFVCSPPWPDGRSWGECKFCQETRWFAGQQEEAQYQGVSLDRGRRRGREISLS